MRAPILPLIFVALLCCVAADKPPVERFEALATDLTKETVERLRAKKELQSVRFGGVEFLVLDAGVGFGVPHFQVGVYAPDEDGKFHRCLFAESWAAGWLKATLNEKTGILELRENANTKLKGEVVLSCNLKSIGTQNSADKVRHKAAP